MIRLRHILTPMLPLCLVTLAVSGCATHLYNAARDKQAQAAVKAASENKLTDTVDEVDKRFAALLALELEASAKMFAGIRDRNIRGLAFRSESLKGTLLKDIDERTLELKGAGGQIARAKEQLNDDKKEREEYEEARKTAKGELDAHIEKYKASIAALEVKEGATFTARWTEAADILRKAIQALENAQKDIGREVVAEERLKEIDAIIAAAAGRKVDTSKMSRDIRTAVAIAGSFRAIAANVDQMLQDAGRARLTPLLMARDHQQALIDRGAKVKAALDRRVEASEKVVKAYDNELAALESISRQLNRPEQIAWRNRTLLQLTKELPPRERRRLYALLGKYFDDIPRYQTEQALWEYRRLAAIYDQSIVSSRYSAMMWQNLLDGVTKTLAEYHASGIKPQDFAPIIQALSVMGIAAGVNR